MQRRQYLRALGAAVSASLAGCVGETEPGAPRSLSGPPIVRLETVDDRVTELMDQAQVPGGAVAIAKDGRLVFVRGYGYANRETGEPVEPTSLFRIASVSKPVTAVSLLTLLEDDRLALDTPAFEILSRFVSGARRHDPRLWEITVEDFLYHTGGWDVRQLGFDIADPLWDPLLNLDYIASAREEEPPVDVESVIRFMVERPLHFDPGDRFAYLNVGYSLLGRVIEEVTGRPYETYVAEEVLAEMGISRMRIGATRPEERAAAEVSYYDRPTAARVPSVFPDEGKVSRPDGGFHLETLDAAGGWIASAVDLMRFVTNVDGSRGTASVLSPETRRRMVARPPLSAWRDADEYYAMGWLVRPADSDASAQSAEEPPAVRGQWWHDGSLPGTVSVLSRSGEDELAWTALFNRRPRDLHFVLDVHDSIGRTVREVDKWPSWDLFDRY